MKTKEAIEHVKHKYVAYDDEYCSGTEEIEKLYKQQDEVIEVLIRGEKYEAMWEELKNYKWCPIKPEMESIKQKYFPKGDNYGSKDK